jgi:lysozyme
MLHADYLARIKVFEGYTPRAKPDYGQFSVGYGTKARFEGETIDKAEAERRFKAEISEAARLVDRFAPQLDEGTRAALTSLTFNAGTAWMKSGLGSAVRSGDMDEVRRIFVLYNKAGGNVLPGLVSRRLAELAWIGGGPRATEAALDQYSAPSGGNASGVAGDRVTSGAPSSTPSAPPPAPAPPSFAASAVGPLSASETRWLTENPREADLTNELAAADIAFMQLMRVKMKIATMGAQLDSLMKREKKYLKT